jgi:hypothetical protein
MQFAKFWHQYIRQHAGHGGRTIQVDPAIVFAMVLCLTVLLAWCAFQMYARCMECGAVPARCRCHREH